MSDTELYSVDIAGVQLKLRSPLSPHEVKMICDLVDEQVSEHIKKSKSGSIQTAAILAALNLAEELLATKKQGLQALDKVNGKLQSVATKVNRLVDKSAPLDLK